MFDIKAIVVAVAGIAAATTAAVVAKKITAKKPETKTVTTAIIDENNETVIEEEEVEDKAQHAANRAFETVSVTAAMWTGEAIAKVAYEKFVEKKSLNEIIDDFRFDSFKEHATLFSLVALAKECRTIMSTEKFIEDQKNKKDLIIDAATWSIGYMAITTIANEALKSANKFGDRFAICSLIGCIVAGLATSEASQVFFNKFNKKNIMNVEGC